MSRRGIERIREMVRQGRYDMSAHAMEEMAEDQLDIEDIEHAIVGGSIARIEKDDPRGIKYVIEGKGLDPMVPMGVVARFAGLERCLIITVYRITDPQG